MKAAAAATTITTTAEYIHTKIFPLAAGLVGRNMDKIKNFCFCYERALRDLLGLVGLHCTSLRCKKYSDI